ncbi:MAG: class I tRNA ligase family protein, partial [Nanoarchaeota archaeon]
MADKYDPQQIEPTILDFWQQNNIYRKAKDKVKGAKPFYFLDGPPYTSGKVHIGTAWNKSLKDMFLRIKRMQGFDVWDRAGYDMHGLPVENATQKRLGLTSKEDIAQIGTEKFLEECKKTAVDNMLAMNEDFKRLGVWMDFENAYQSITKKFMDAEWWLIKQAHEKGRLYEGLRTMTWCANAESALAKHELEYHTVTDTSIFVKFKLKDKENEYLIIWTTTPWTIPFNLAVMVNPEIEYIRAKVGDEVW